MNIMRSVRLHHLHVASWVLVLAGVVALATGLSTANGELWQLIGLMLLLAGGVKVAIIHLWRRLAGLETDRHHPVPPT